MWRSLSLSSRVFDQVGGFDEAFFAYLEDVDIGLRGRLRGYNFYQPAAQVLHAGHGSSLAEDRYVELITRNRLLLFVKNIPFALLVQHAIRIGYGQIYFFAAYRRPLASLKGYAGFFRALPQALRDRRQNLGHVVLKREEIAALLHKRMPLTPFRSLRKRMSGAQTGRGIRVPKQG